MPLQRRIPKFGFTNIFKVTFQVVNLDVLQQFSEKTKETVINTEVLLKHGLISKNKGPVKVLGSGELKAKLQVEANAFSNSAKEKIEAAGGSIKTI
jgi:large subunit ribosomal protein L15